MRFESRAGIPITIRLPFRNPGWNHIQVGSEVEILVHSSISGKSTYEVLFPPKKATEKELKRALPPAKDKRTLSTPSPPDESEQPQSEDQQFIGQDYGIDPDYFHEREKESHRYEIMAFLREHLYDEFIEWYQMQPAIEARFSDPEKPIHPGFDRVLHQVDKNFIQFYQHQAQALDSIQKGRNLVIVTQTASGKTMCYNPAIFSHFYKNDSTASAIYLFPLNALMMDQKEKIDSLIAGIRKSGIQIDAELLRGGIPRDRRHEIAQKSPDILALNPELLGTILGESNLWQQFFSRLRYVVIDEVHSYRGIFGMHMAGLLRRLRITAASYGGNPQFILSSATVSNPMDLVTRLTSLPEASFDILTPEEDGSQQACKHWVVLNPDFLATGNGYDNHLVTAAAAMVELICSSEKNGQPSPLNTIVFAISKRDVNKIYDLVVKNLINRRPELVPKVKKYISGDLQMSKKQEIYEGLKSGRLVGVVSTNALEAGIDIGRLDACIIAGFPFWMMTMRQMAGRVGRHAEGLVCFIPQSMRSVDQYYRENPSLLLEQPPEVFAVDPTNPYIARKHINAAAHETTGLDRNDFSIYFGEKSQQVIDKAISDGVMHDYGTHLQGTKRHWKNTNDPYSITNIRSKPQIPYVICKKTDTCQLKSICFDEKSRACSHRIAILDQQYAYRDCHPGAIYEAVDGRLFKIISFDDKTRAVKAAQLPDDCLERTFVDEDTTINIIDKIKQHKSLELRSKLFLGEIKVIRSFSGFYTYSLILNRRCRKCKTEVEQQIKKCPVCLRATSIFYDQSKPEYQDFPDPYRENGLHISMNTISCWMTVPAEQEVHLNSASTCKLPGIENRVLAFLKKELQINGRYKNLNLNDNERKAISEYHTQASHSIQNRRNNRHETLVYPGVYGQCLIHTLRDNIISESRTLDLFQATTGYQVTDDLKHICRKCQSSSLFPALHTLEHTVTNRYPSVALGDHSDVQSYTTLGHPDTASPTIFWYDNYEGGLGAADKIFDKFDDLLKASQRTLLNCSCSSLEGCPNCTQISTCERGNEALIKVAGQVLIAILQNQFFSVPFVPYIYSIGKRNQFRETHQRNEHVSQEHGVGEEEPKSAKSEPLDPYLVLKVQQEIHDKVLKKAYEIRSVEITHEVPPISATDLNSSYQKIYKSKRPMGWQIKETMTPYQVMQVIPAASFSMIQQIFRTIAKEIHPDLNSHNRKDATEMMRVLNNAYDEIQQERKSTRY